MSWSKTRLHPALGDLVAMSWFRLSLASTMLSSPPGNGSTHFTAITQGTHILQYLYQAGGA